MANKTFSFFQKIFDKSVGSLSIRRTLPLIIVTPLLVSVTVISWFNFQAGKQEIEKLMLKISEKSTQMIELNLRNYLGKPKVLLPAYFAAIQSGNVDINNLQEVKRYFWQQLEKTNALTSIYIGTEKGNYVHYEKTENEFIEKFRDESTNGNRNLYEVDSKGNRIRLIKSVEYDPRARLWYEFSKSIGRPSWSPVYQLASINTLGMDFSIPIYDRESGSFEGVISTDISLVQISKFLRNLEISQNGKALVIERTGDVIAISTLEQPFKVVNNQNKRLNMSESQDPIIQGINQYLIEKFNGLDQIKEKQQFTFRFKGNSQLVQVTPLQQNQEGKEIGCDWLMVVVIPYSDFLQYIYTYTTLTIIIGVLVAGIGVILALLMVRWIIKPIEQLQQAAHTIESQNFDQSILEEVSRRRDEFGQLGKVMLAMANVIYSREQNWKQMIDQLQNQDLQKQKTKSGNNSQKQVKNLEILLRESQQLRTKIGENDKNQR
ncbi:putative sensor protein [Planktothrix agardhii CCAP 1459/11A]|uniref:histidine kinase n=1 Tax=Planktothrix agardhii CCAP 1459/11A TaxID=282420 RepID=A0A4P6A495_PLAAG|nr:HAMP domain-containing protein [Planktothrix agardhii]GDZ95967.1 putative sensor protein [Planktothrix agardhii CCAP 1459/11A]